MIEDTDGGGYYCNNKLSDCGGDPGSPSILDKIIRRPKDKAKEDLQAPETIKSNISIPFSKWEDCVGLWYQRTCGYASSSLKLKFTNLDITTSAETFTIGGITMNRSGDLDLSFSVDTTLDDGTEVGFSYGVSVDSLNSIKSAGEMSVTLHKDHASGNFTAGFSNEYKPGNMFLMQTLGGIGAAIAFYNPQIVGGILEGAGAH